MPITRKHLPLFGLGLIAAWTTLAAGVEADDLEVDRGFLPPGTRGLLSEYSMGALLGAMLTLIAVTLIVVRLSRGQRRELRREVLGLSEGPRFAVVDAMVHCVWRGGEINEDRLARALQIAREAIGMDFSEAHLREAALRADRLIGPGTFWHMRDGMTRGERMVVFNAALSVLLEDGPLTPGDRAMLKSLSRGLRLRRDDLRDLGRLIPQ
ncbi:hypothetical protein [Jannaschia formosa]|uniref:hypothetical protein n=1 Tax=Jannaschia formosa TaxID=2259592 RepID=UPI0010751FB0|nr:hypothetical protein [Jannaschia formosa]TFL18347.1 hypothetical protein DR046_09625 [Jannaschia formosa]